MYWSRRFPKVLTNLSEVDVTRDLHLIAVGGVEVGHPPAHGGHFVEDERVVEGRIEGIERHGHVRQNGRKADGVAVLVRDAVMNVVVVVGGEDGDGEARCSLPVEAGQSPRQQRRIGRRQGGVVADVGAFVVVLQEGPMQGTGPSGVCRIPAVDTGVGDGFVGAVDVKDIFGQIGESAVMGLPRGSVLPPWLSCWSMSR